MIKKLPFVALFIASTIYGLGNILLRFIGDQNYFSVVCLKLLFSVIMMLPILKLSNGLGEVRSLKALRLIVILGVFHAVGWVSLYFAVTNTSVANAMFGTMATPIFVIVLSPSLLKEHINKSIAAALALALAGIILIFGPETLIRSIAPVGTVSGIFTGFAWAMVEVVGRKLKDQYSPLPMTFLGTIVATLIVFPLFLLNGATAPNINSATIILLVAVCSTSATALIFYGLKNVFAQSAAIILLLEPFVSIVAAFAIFFETPSLLAILGASLIVIADIVVIRNQP